MYKYDIPFPKDGQLTLMYDGMPLNVSKSKAYLIEKMKAHRDDMLTMGIYDKSAEYEIIDNDNNLIFKHIFQDGEAGNAKISYHKEPSDKEHYIEKDGFKLLTNEEGRILTDEELLKYLKWFRQNNSFPVMVTNRALVSMATYKPQNKEEFISLKGLGERTYSKCGEEFINAIKSYISAKPEK